MDRSSPLHTPIGVTYTKAYTRISFSTTRKWSNMQLEQKRNPKTKTCTWTHLSVSSPTWNGLTMRFLPGAIRFLAVQEAGSVGKTCNVEIRFDWCGRKDMQARCRDSLVFVWKLLRLTVPLSSKANRYAQKQTYVAVHVCADSYGMSNTDTEYEEITDIYPSIHVMYHNLLVYCIFK